MSCITCTKKFGPYPFAHRQHMHPGHCSLIHGHNWDFELEFGANKRDASDFVVDFGDFDWLKLWLAEMFDHTLILNGSDPSAEYLIRVLQGSGEPKEVKSMARIRLLASCSSEGIAQAIYDYVWPKIRDRTSDRTWLTRITVFEDNKNSATIIA